LITSDKQPIQIIFAGKAHPKDNQGKELIKNIIQFCHRPSVRHRVVFLEDYDISIARHLVQGSDVWLNTPRRPMEACGTSGMKAAVNGVLNVSIPDGWWAEGFTEDRGWTIGRGEVYNDHSYQDAVESQALYNILENDVIPSFYDKKNGSTPSHWVKKMKQSIKAVLNQFCTHHMVSQYEKKFYLPTIEQHRKMLSDRVEMAQKLVEQRKRLKALWANITIDQPLRSSEGPFKVGDTFELTSEVFLGRLSPEEVVVELYYGNFKSLESVSKGRAAEMAVLENRGDGRYLYGCTLSCETTGRYGFTARVTPQGDDFIRHTPGLITWA
jgi:starch phosphorylase